MMTVEEFEAYERLPENSDRRMQLINGKIVEDERMVAEGVIVATIAGMIGLYAKNDRIGYGLLGVGCKLENDIYNFRSPDIAYLTRERRKVDMNDYLSVIPELCVEVLSQPNSVADLRERGDYFLKHGAELMWLVYPKQEVIEVVTAKGERLILGIDDMISGGDVLPGFTASVREIFKI